MIVIVYFSYHFLGAVISYCFDQKCLQIYTLSKKFSSLSNGPSSKLHGKVVPIVDWGNQEESRKVEGVRQLVDNVCHVLESGHWGPALENALSKFVEKPQPELVFGVLRRLKDAKLAIQYFRWVERKAAEAHCPESYDSLLMVMARSRNFDCLEQILEEMSFAGFGLSNRTSVELIASCVKSQKQRDAFDIIQTMRKFKFRPAFTAYSTLIGALSAVHESGLCSLSFIKCRN
ncbi:putative Pentatricopeptide repeat-containing protein [Quillaja saponaria]|uniref:Pentatricopeptide repeat-containing protein n=1 Tax=Quillaja saponaria TaxID=32244 RepID=A0AAD7LD52_QUISA|nr:putative Pentatricopeptide repeat-containing protein [Quillaja saponaria]